MALATVLSRAQNGLQADPVTVEINLGPGMPGVTVVGLPDAAVREAKDRVRAAIVNCGFKFPGTRRLTVNLAPADLPKDGGRFDLAIALGILAASGQIPAAALRGLEVLGELSLTGELRPIAGALPAALKAAAAGHRLLVPESNGGEAALAPRAQVLTARHLGELCDALHSGALPSPAVAQRAPVEAGPDLADVRGQYQARRALEVAAAGAHSLAMSGPPGSGKSMLAQRLPSVLPPLTEEEAIEVAAIASIASGGFDPRRWGLRPYRAPHHTASDAALVGGGAGPRPGEITLAHHGVLFLDELPEFHRPVLEALREPLETGSITVSRAARQIDFPARFQLVAAMNPCPCGHLGDNAGSCHCTPNQVLRYRARLSGPLLDRIDLQIFVPRIDRAMLTAERAPPAESSAAVRARVTAARERQLARQRKPNATLAPRELDRHCPLERAARTLLDHALGRLSLSARAYHRVLKVSRTIADLAGCEAIAPAHVAEAVRYRQLDRRG